MNPLKKIAVSLAALAFVASASHAFAASAAADAASQKVAVTKAVEAPAVAVSLVKHASKEAKTDIAVAVVTSGLKSHPSALSSILAGVLKAAPESTEAVVNAALDVLPDASITIVRIASEAVPAKADVALAAASKRVPSKSLALEREVASVRSRRLAATPTVSVTGAALTGGTETQTPSGRTPPVQVNSYGGSDPGRP
jgi:hypothetical protein